MTEQEQPSNESKQDLEHTPRGYFRRYIRNLPPQGISCDDQFKPADIIEQNLKEMIGETYDPGDFELTDEYMQARKEFLLGMFDYFEERQRGAKTTKDIESLDLLAAMIEEELMSGSPNITNYIGSYDDIMDVLVVADRSVFFEEAQWELVETVMQGLTFSSEVTEEGKEEEELEQIDMFKERVLQATPDMQLRYLRLYKRFADNATEASYGDRARRCLVSVFEKIQDSALPALSTIVARSQLELVKKGTTDGLPAVSDGVHIWFDEKYGYTPVIEIPETYRNKYHVGKIAKDFVGLRNRGGGIYHLAQVAIPKADMQLAIKLRAIDLGRYQFRIGEIREYLRNNGVNDAFIDVFNNALSSSTLDLLGESICAENKTRLDGFESVEQSLADLVGADRAENIAILFQEMHQPDVRSVVEDSLHVSFSDISLRAQIYLLEFMSSRSKEDFAKLTTTTANFEGDKTVLLDAFLALEHGDDFGDIILDIAELAEAEEAQSLFKAVF